jgi:hypothetical protein
MIALDFPPTLVIIRQHIIRAMLRARGFARARKKAPEYDRYIHRPERVASSPRSAARAARHEFGRVRRRLAATIASPLPDPPTANGMNSVLHQEELMPSPPAKRTHCETCNQRLSTNGRCYKCRPGGHKGVPRGPRQPQPNGALRERVIPANGLAVPALPPAAQLRRAAAAPAVADELATFALEAQAIARVAGVLCELSLESAQAVTTFVADRLLETEDPR